LADIDALNNNVVNGTKDQIKDIMRYSATSCFRANGSSAAPRVYTGLPGLARIISESPLLGRALAIQIQQNLMNRSPEESATLATIQFYEANGQTLKAALRGYFLSDV